jgi:hypothetical protein
VLFGSPSISSGIFSPAKSVFDDADASYEEYIFEKSDLFFS